MDPETIEVYKALLQEVAHAHRRWKFYVQLFGRDQGAVDLLNNVAPEFFSMSQSAIFECTLLHICRITDPKDTRRKSNLSMHRLFAMLECDGISFDKSKIATLELVTQFARDWRNRGLAHRDLSVALGKDDEKLAFASRKKVDDALNAIASCLNIVATMIGEPPTDFSYEPVDIDGLLLTLQKGLSSILLERTNRF
jgi:hypothetical protein